MDQQCQAILDAFSAIQNPYSTNEQRGAATEFIEVFKQQKDCAACVYQILKYSESIIPMHADYVRFLSLKVLEDWISTFLNDFSPEMQIEIRSGVWNLVNSHVFLYQDNKSIRTKLAKMLADIAKRQYPQNWGTFLDDMVGAWSQDSLPRAEICVLAIEFLIEDCVDGDFNSALPAQRRNDILTALKEKQEPLLQYTISFIGRYSNEIFSMISAQSPATAYANEAHMVNTALSMLCPFAALATPDEICSEASNFTTILPILFAIPSLQTHAAKLVSILISQKLSSDLFFEFLKILPGAIFESVSVYSSSDIAEVFNYNRIVTGSLCSMFAHNLSNFEEKRFQEQPQLESIVKSFFEVIAKLLGHPSRLLALEVVKDLVKIFRDDFSSKYPWLSDVAVHCLSIFSVRTVKVLWDEEEVASSDVSGRNEPCSTTEDEDAAVDFESKAAYMEHFGLMRSQVRLLISIVASKFPDPFVDFIGRKLIWLRETHSTTTNSTHLNEVGGCTYNSAAVLEWDAFACFVDSGIQSVIQTFEKSLLVDLSSSETPVPLLTALLEQRVVLPRGLSDFADLLLSLAEGTNYAQDPMLLLQILRCVKSLTPFLKVAPGTLVKVYGTLFRHMNYGSAVKADDLAHLSNKTSNKNPYSIFLENANQVRKMSGTVIAHLSATCIDTLITTNLVDQLCAHAMEALNAQTNAVQRTSMLETLVSLAGKIEDISRRRDVYFQLLGNVVATLTSVQVTQLFSNSVNFLLALESEDGRKCYDESVEALSTFVSVCRRVGFPRLPLEIWTHSASFSIDDLATVFPLAHIWTAILPTIVSATAVLHELWNPAVRLAIVNLTLPTGYALRQSHYLTSPPMLASLYDPMIAGGNADTMKITNTSKGNHRLIADLDAEKLETSTSADGGLGVVIYHLRYQLYQLLGLAAGQKVIFVHPSFSTLCDIMSRTCVYIDNKHMTQLLKYFLEPFALNAHPFVYDSTASFISSMLYGVLDRLTVGWSQREAANIASGTDTTVAIKQFIYRDAGISPSSDLTSEEADAQRLTIITTMTKHYADFLLSIICCRGFLSPTPLEKSKTTKKQPSKDTDEDKMADGSSRVGGLEDSSMLDDEVILDSADGNEDEKQVEARRNCILQLVLSTEIVRSPYLCSVLLLLSLPDSVCSKKAMIILEFLIPLVHKFPELLIPLGREAFSVSLGVIFRQEKWSKGLEWDFISLIELIYSTMIPETIALDDTFSPQRFTSQRLPREVFLSLGVPSEMLQKLEERLIQLKNKKKRRDTFRDFLIEIAPGVGAGSLQGIGHDKLRGSSTGVILNIP